MPRNLPKKKKRVAKKGRVKAKKNPFPSDHWSGALGHPPALGAWRPLPLQQQLDAFAAAVASRSSVLSSGKPAAPYRDFLMPRHAAAAAAASPSAGKPPRQQEDLAAAAANQETAATAADASSTAAEAGELGHEGDPAAAAAAATADVAAGSPSAAAATAARATANAALLAGSLYSGAKYREMLAALDSFQEAAEARRSRSSSSSCAAADAAAEKQQPAFTELQQLLLLLGQASAPACRLQQLDSLYRWYQTFWPHNQQQQQQRQQRQQQQQQESHKQWGGSPSDMVEFPLRGSAFWVPDEDAHQQQQQQQRQQQQQQQQRQQQQQQQQRQHQQSFNEYVQSHRPVCTAADKLRLYGMKLLFTPDPQQQQQQQGTRSSKNPFAYSVPAGQPPWGLVLQHQQHTGDASEGPSAAAAARPRQWQFDGSCC
ncbi:hypothetical protein Efla_004583 [Eimeria flavescens]